MLKNTGAFIALCFITVLFAAGCSSKQTKVATDDTLQLPVITLKEKDTVLQTGYVADIQSVKNVDIRSRLKGFLEKIYIDEGMHVKKGQMLFKINDDEYQVALSKAKAALSNAVADAVAARVEVGRVKLLVNKNVISASELEIANSKLAADRALIDEARSNVETARAHIGYTNIRAPFDGLIDRLPLKSGSLIEEGTLLTSLSDNSSVYAYFSFPENEYLQYQRTKNKLTQTGENEVKLILADGSRYAFPGKIQLIEGEIEQNTGSIDLRAKFPNPNNLLRHGASGKVFIPTKIENAVLVPQISVFDIQDKNYVYIVDKNNQLHMKSFMPLTRFSDYYIVKSGLNTGDRILFEGAQNARDGMTIIPEPAKEAELAVKK